MRKLNFDLKLALLAMSNVCVMAWAGSALSNSKQEIAVFFVVPIFASVTCAWYGTRKGKSPIAVGTLGAFVATALLIVCCFVAHGIGYFFYTGTIDYFEDGAVAELIVFPVVMILFWGSFAAIFGAITGTLVWLIRKYLIAGQ